MTKINWLHISDFHIGKDDYPESQMLKYVIEHIQEQKDNGLIPDFIFITGDISWSGRTGEYTKFKTEFLIPVQTLIGNGIQDRTFIVPGNHDVERDKIPSYDRKDILNDPTYFDPTEKGAELRNKFFIPQIKSFLDSDESCVKGDFAEKGFFSKKINLHGISIGIAGINTAWLSKDREDIQKLTPGKQLLEEALCPLEDSDIILVLGHHPLEFMYPPDKDRIASLLKKKNALYLQGHMHSVDINYGTSDLISGIQSGALFQAREEDKYKNVLLWAEFQFVNSCIKLQPFYWSARRQDWVLSTESFPRALMKNNWWYFNVPINGYKIKPPVVFDSSKILIIENDWKFINLRRFFESVRHQLDIDEIRKLFGNLISSGEVLENGLLGSPETWGNYSQFYQFDSRHGVWLYNDYVLYLIYKFFRQNDIKVFHETASYSPKDYIGGIVAYNGRFKIKRKKSGLYSLSIKNNKFQFHTTFDPFNCTSSTAKSTVTGGLSSGLVILRISGFKNYKHDFWSISHSEVLTGSIILIGGQINNKNFDSKSQTRILTGVPHR